MAIAFKCTCGKVLKTADEHAGRKATCPQCQAKLIVPEAPAAAASGGAAPDRAVPPPLPSFDLDGPGPTGDADRAYDVQREEVTTAPRPEADRRTPPAYDDDRDYRRPVRGRNIDRPYARPGYGDDYGPYDDRLVDRIRRRPPPPAPTRTGWTDKGVVAGLGMMAGGAALTIIPLFLGVIVYWGPILFIAGLICFFKGLASGRV
jgi:hypothetical protein